MNNNNEYEFILQDIKPLTSDERHVVIDDVIQMGELIKIHINDLHVILDELNIIHDLSDDELQELAAKMVTYHSAAKASRFIKGKVENIFELKKQNKGEQHG